MIAQRLLILLTVLLSTVAVAQKRKPVIRYKTIYDKQFAVGDRIDLGEMQVVLLELDKDSLVIPDSLGIYRAFVQENTLMRFKLHMLWKNQGIKYPGRTDRTRERLLTWINDDGPDANGSEEDSTCYIYTFKHTFVKQEPLLRIELEVIGIEAPNQLGKPVHGAISLPEMNVLYRNYDNLVEFAASGIHDNCWLDASGVTLTSGGPRGTVIARVAGTADKTATIAIRTATGGDPSTLGTYRFRISNLPQPTVYFGTIELGTIGIAGETAFLTMNALFAKYPPEIPLKASFDVGETVLCIGGKTYTNNGKLLSKEILQAYEEAETGTEFVIESVEVKGPARYRIEGPFRHVKLSPKGAKFKTGGPIYSEGC